MIAIRTLGAASCDARIPEGKTAKDATLRPLFLINSFLLMVYLSFKVASEIEYFTAQFFKQGKSYHQVTANSLASHNESGSKSKINRAK